MSVLCATAEDFAAALDAFATDEMDAAVGEAAKAYATAVYHYTTELKTTWSPQQPGDIWTGQFRYSVNIGVNEIIDSALPPLEHQPWPIADSQYGESDVISGLEAVASIQPYDVVYITDSAQNAQEVEDHTRIFEASAQLAAQDMQAFDAGASAAAKGTPF